MHRLRACARPSHRHRGTRRSVRDATMLAPAATGPRHARQRGQAATAHRRPGSHRARRDRGRRSRFRAVRPHARPLRRSQATPVVRAVHASPCITGRCHVAGGGRRRQLCDVGRGGYHRRRRAGVLRTPADDECHDLVAVSGRDLQSDSHRRPERRGVPVGNGVTGSGVHGADRPDAGWTATTTSCRATRRRQRHRRRRAMMRRLACAECCCSSPRAAENRPSADTVHQRRRPRSRRRRRRNIITEGIHVKRVGQPRWLSPACDGPNAVCDGHVHGDGDRAEPPAHRRSTASIRTGAACDDHPTRCTWHSRNCRRLTTRSRADPGVCRRATRSRYPSPRQRGGRRADRRPSAVDGV